MPQICVHLASAHPTPYRLSARCCKVSGGLTFRHPRTTEVFLTYSLGPNQSKVIWGEKVAEWILLPRMYAESQTTYACPYQVSAQPPNVVRAPFRSRLTDHPPSNATFACFAGISRKRATLPPTHMPLPLRAALER